MTWDQVITTYGGLLATVVTAVATILLWRVTAVLAVETRRMAQATSQPHIVATIESSRVSMMHLNLDVANTGNGTAYDIQVSFSPPLPQDRMRQDRVVPLQRVSVLRPGKSFASFLCEYEQIKDMKFEVTTSWRRDTAKSVRETNTYTLDMASLEGISRLGGHDALTEIADHLKKIQEDWRPVTRGSQRLKVDGFSSGDRLHEHRQNVRWRRRMLQEQQNESGLGTSLPEA